MSIFGTDGIRRKISDPLFSNIELIKIGKAVGAFLTQTTQSPLIFLGQDTRESCATITQAFLEGLLTYPVTIKHCGVVATPVIAKLTAQYKADLGIMISASHNSFLYNGLKFMTPQGKLSHKEEYTIEKLYNHQDATHKKQQGHVDLYKEGLQEYLQYIHTAFSPQLCKGLEVILDCAHGALSSYAATIFEELGARVTTLHNKPNGMNINNDCGIIHYKKLQSYMQLSQAHIGFCFDGDGDRVYALTPQGVCKNGDDIAYLLHTLNSTYKQQPFMVGTIMSNAGLEQEYKKQNTIFVRKPVGDKHISTYLKEHNGLLGAEPSGHIICYDWSFCSDGLYTALKLIETLKPTHNWNCISFPKFYQVTKNIPVQHKKNLEKEPYRSLMYSFEQKLEPGRLIVRYSGTENVLRITGEGPEKQLTNAVVQELYTTLLSLL